MTTEEAVLSIADKMAQAEATAANLLDILNDLPALFKAVEDNGDCSTFERHAMSGQARAIGHSAVGDTWTLHHMLIEIAKARGIDLISITGGGPR